MNNIDGKEFICSYNLKINEQIAIITSKIDNEICQSWEINKEDIIDAINFRNKLIKYLEDKIKECNDTIELLDGTNSHRISILQVQIKSYQDILKRVRNDNYE